jgi:hypothetical protein
MNDDPKVLAATEKIARRMARQAGQPEAFWELHLTQAYEEYHGLNARPCAHGVPRDQLCRKCLAGISPRTERPEG